MAVPELTLHALARSGLVLAGLLCLVVGLGNAIAGRSKLRQYEEVVRSTPPPAPRNPAALFPQASEAQEHRAIALAKLGFYQVVLLAGQALSALGFILVACGVVQLRRRTARVSRPMHAPN